MKNLFVVLLALGLTLTACGTKEGSSDGGSGTSMFEADVSAVELDGSASTVAGLTFTPPTEWSDLGPSGMRQANYGFGPLKGEPEASEVAVYYFGVNSGGSVEANLSRWISQITGPDGVPVTGSAIQSQFTTNDLKVSTVEAFGAYAGSMGGPMGGSSAPKENFRLYGAVVEGPQGNVFFKLTGPDQTSKAMAEGFVAMIRSVTVESSAGY